MVSSFWGIRLFLFSVNNRKKRNIAGSRPGRRHTFSACSEKVCKERAPHDTAFRCRSEIARTRPARTNRPGSDSARSKYIAPAPRSVEGPRKESGQGSDREKKFTVYSYQLSVREKTRNEAFPKKSFRSDSHPITPRQRPIPVPIKAIASQQTNIENKQETLFSGQSRYQ